MLPIEPEFRELAETRMVVRGSIFAISPARFQVDAWMVTIAEGFLVELDYTHKQLNEFDAGGRLVLSDETELGKLLSDWKRGWSDYLVTEEAYVALYPYDQKKGKAVTSPTDWRFLQTIALCCKKLEDSWMKAGGRDRSKNTPERKALEKAFERLSKFLQEQNRKVAEALAALPKPG
jgi:hypothetical protein